MEDEEPIAEFGSDRDIQRAPWINTREAVPVDGYPKSNSVAPASQSSAAQSLHRRRRSSKPSNRRRTHNQIRHKTPPMIAASRNNAWSGPASRGINSVEHNESANNANINKSQRISFQFPLIVQPHSATARTVDQGSDPVPSIARSEKRCSDRRCEPNSGADHTGDARCTGTAERSKAGPGHATDDNAGRLSNA